MPGDESKRIVRTRTGRLVRLPDDESSRAARRQFSEKYGPYQQRLAEAVAAEYPYPEGQFSGRGVVTCAGGRRYFPCAWVMIQMLRKLGCTLPVELWHRDAEEMTPVMKAILAPLGVTCVDGSEIRKQYPVRILNGLELKPYSIIHSRFQEVLFIDADNVPCVNPEFLFDAPEYQRTGAIFWPDFPGAGDRRCTMWRVCEVPPRDEPAFESGQMLIDKRRSWKLLQVTMHMNEYSDFYYHHTNGDKDTFHMAWRRLNRPYAMPSRGLELLWRTVMCQHDFQGRRIFQHRSNPEWTLDGDNPHVDGFLFEPECLALLDDLRRRWHEARLDAQTAAERALYEGLVQQRRFIYARGDKRRDVELLTDFRMRGGDGEKTWDLRETDGRTLLRITPERQQCDTGETVELEPDGVGGFHANDPQSEPITLVPRREG